tara:strand:+ start:36600 stop:36818 length:219 start_codon:yes stop_codon:yes gene_type:complete
MPLPSPKKEQSKDEFINSCMADSTMRKEFTNQSQRAAVCYSQYDRAKKSKASIDWTTYALENFSKSNSIIVF